ncbi:sensor domain-containing diguanylate cyclase [Desulfopila sp. IMCC35008]|uniref:sensor domain-containing diguanylate cyclase n=1 Tax=Desulfopila sp. IMCC35008 TaxID=2653858 RepID=UPI0013D699C6|nr:sensor domain-containing diguanylate cyclase [Desulfopila sp. IMCC35008]
MQLFLKFLKNQSLINKMRLLNILGTTVVMFVVLVFFSILYSFFARQELADSLLAEARLLATNTAPMLVFQDKDETRKLAASFKRTSNLLRVIVFDQNNDIFVELISGGEENTTSYRTRVPAIHRDSTSFESQKLVAFAPVYVQEERVGTVVLEGGLDTIRTNLLLFVYIGGGATILGILLSAHILKRMQQWALGPILDMSKLAEKVATDKSYHLRANDDGKDEVARLATRFNQMLERIEAWDKKLSMELDQSRESERHLDALARTDELTGCPNRHAFRTDVKTAVDNAVKGDETTALMFIDLDDFKQVNDVHGHHYGDVVLQIVSKRIKTILQGTDTLYRLGGDEFAVLLTGVYGEKSVAGICKRLIAAVSKPIVIREAEETITVGVGASVGIASCPENARKTQDLLRMADLAMYAAKNEGKNSYRIFELGME